jgi:hypothetical protein
MDEKQNAYQWLIGCAGRRRAENGGTWFRRFPFATPRASLVATFVKKR